jgi:uncharacterized protein
MKKNCLKLLSAAWAVSWRVVLFLVIWGFLLAPVIVPFAGSLEGSRPAGSFRMMMFEAAAAFTVVLAAFIMIRFIEKRSFVSLGFAPRFLMRDLFLGIGLGACWLFLSVAVLWLSGCAKFQTAGTVPLATLFITCGSIALNAFTQEVLVRSYIFQTINSRTSQAFAIISSSVLFSAFHAGAFKAGSFLPALNVFMAGVLFGIAYYRSGNLWLPTGIHFIWNFMLGPILGLTVSGKELLAEQSPVFILDGPAILTGGSFGIEGGLCVTFATVVFIVATVFICSKLGVRS